MKCSIAAILFFMALNAQAEVFTCVFPDPVLMITYNGETQRLTIQESDELPENAGIIPSVRIYITEQNKISIVTADNKKILSLSHTEKATVGTSSEVYPFEATFTYPFDQNKAPQDDKNLFKSQQGACESSLLKKESK